MFLLVPAHPGCPGQYPESRKAVVCVCGCVCVCQDKLSTILDTLTPDDVRVLVETVDEYHRRGNFQRIFPSSQSYKYLAFCEQPRYYNLLLDAWVRRYPGSNPQGMFAHLSPDYNCVSSCRFSPFFKLCYL